MNHHRHVYRAFVVVGVILFLILAGRAYLVPSTYGQYGKYRAAHLDEARDIPALHQGDDACLECHEKEWDMADGKHTDVPCEICHFSAAPHAQEGKGDLPVKDPDLAKYRKLADMPVDRSREACLNCHVRLSSRPEKFPQVKDVDKHVKDGWKPDLGQLEPKAACQRCHKAHFPSIVKTQENE